MSPPLGRSKMTARTVIMISAVYRGWRYALDAKEAYGADDYFEKPFRLVPLIKAGLVYRGFALIEVISPCVTFNNNEGSTKSYAHTRQFDHHVVDLDYIPPAEEIPGIESVEARDAQEALLRWQHAQRGPISPAEITLIVFVTVTYRHCRRKLLDWYCPCIL